MNFAIFNNNTVSTFDNNIIGFPSTNDHQFVLTRENNNGTINAYLATDMSNLITGILNPNNIICQKGDLVLLYKVNIVIYLL